MKRIILICFLVISLSTYNVQMAYASAGQAVLEVVGGSIAAGGLTAETIAALGPYAVAIVTAACIAMGVNVYLTEQSKAAGMTKTDFVYNQIKDWCVATGNTVGDFTSKILEGTTVGKDGTIYLDQTASKTISQFGEWAWDADRIIDTTTSQGNVVTFGDLQCPVIQTCDYESLSFTNANPITLTTNKPVALVLDSNGNLYMFNREASTNYQCRFASGGYYQSTLGSVVNGYHYDGVYYNPTVGVGVMVPTIPGGRTISNWLSGLSGAFAPTAPDIVDPSADTLTGNKDIYDEKKPGLTLPAPGTLPGIGTGIIDGLLNNPAIDIPMDGTIPLDGYLDGVRDLVNDLPVEVPVVDDVTGVIDYPVIEDIPAEDVITLDDYPSIPDNPDLPDEPYTPVLDVSVPYVATPTSVGELALDLKGVFPFCLPFDCVDMLRKLNASPVTPSYRIYFVLPVTNTVIDTTIDLHDWDGVAQTLRRMELLSFCIGLAIVTRSIFIRS